MSLPSNQTKDRLPKKGSRIVSEEDRLLISFFETPEDNGHIGFKGARKRRQYCLSSDALYLLGRRGTKGALAFIKYINPSYF